MLSCELQRLSAVDNGRGDVGRQPGRPSATLPYAGDVGDEGMVFKTKTAGGAKGDSNEPEQPSAPKLAAPLR